MTIDHVGLFLFPDVSAFRIIGRLSFPLFAWLIANGAYHTKNIKAYLLRLLIFAGLSQIPFYLAFSLINPIDVGSNIFVTLFLGLLAIYAIQKISNKFLWAMAVIICAITALILGSDYGAAGVFSIVGFYLFFKRMKTLIIYQALIYLLFFTIPALIQYSETGYMSVIGLFQPAGLVSLLFIWMYNQKEGTKAKFLFYAFYPLHLLVLYLTQR